MDNYLDKNRFTSLEMATAKKYAETLRFTAVNEASKYLKNWYSRDKFIIEIDIFIHSQLEGIKRSRNENDRMYCINNLREEKKFIDDQSHKLMSRQAKIVVSAHAIKKLDSWGYIINGVGLFIGGVQMVAGAGIFIASVFHGNVIGLAAGAILVMHGLNGIQESYMNLRNDQDDYVGMVKKAYIATAKYMGYSDSAGKVAYSLMDLSLSFYSAGKMILKPDARRLFHYIPSDYVRNFRTMGAPSLIIEGVGDTLSIKSAYDSSRESTD